MRLHPGTQITVVDSDRIDQLICPLQGRSWMHPLRLLARMARLYPGRVALGLGLNFALATMEVAGLTALLPLLLALGIGSEQSDAGLSNAVVHLFDLLGMPMDLVPILILVFGLGIFVAILRAASTIYYSYIAEQLRIDAVTLVVQSMQRATWSQITAEGRGNLFSAIQTESAYVGRVFGNNLRFFGNAIILVTFGTLALLISWQITLLLLVSGGLIGLLLRSLFNATSMAGGRIAQANRSIKQSIQEFLGTQKLIKAMNADKEVGGRIISLTQELCDQHVLTAALPKIATLVIELSLLLVVLIAVYILSQVLRVPIEETLLLLLLFTRLTPRIIDTQHAFQTTLANIPSFEAISSTRQRLLSVPGRNRGHIKFENLRTGIDFDRVVLELEGQQILNGINLFIPARSLVALVGESGGGKTTLLDCLCALRSPDQGEILVDGRPLSDIDTNSWRNRLAIVPQDGSFFRDTIRNNFLIFAPECTDQQIWRALDECAASDFVRRRPEGLDTILDDEGLDLSGGQRQRLAIARALLRKPEVLLLDEPTSALDNSTQTMIKQLIGQLCKRYTIVLVTHRMELAAGVDLVYEIKDGRVVATRDARVRLGSRTLNSSDAIS